MSTYVQIVNSLKSECGVSGATLATLSNQVVEINRLAGWVNQAWVDIQEIHDDWFFLRQSFSFSTVAGQQSYTPTQAREAYEKSLADELASRILSSHGDAGLVAFVEAATDASMLERLTRLIRSHKKGGR